jgi:hypothetical protein
VRGGGGGDFREGIGFFKVECIDIAGGDGVGAHGEGEGGEPVLAIARRCAQVDYKQRGNDLNGARVVRNRKNSAIDQRELTESSVGRQFGEVKPMVLHDDVHGPWTLPDQVAGHNRCRPSTLQRNHEIPYEHAERCIPDSLRPGDMNRSRRNRFFSRQKLFKESHSKITNNQGGS